MHDRKTESFKPLTISVENLPASMARQEAITSYAADRAALLLGCYRTGDANDPETYVAAVTAVLSHYPQEVITAVTHPVSGLPSKKGWLPTVKEVTEACTAAVEPMAENERRLKRIQDQLETRERIERGEKPSLEALKAKYGENWGLSPNGASKPLDTFKAPSIQAIASMYQADPSRIERLMNSDLMRKRPDDAQEVA